MTAQPSRAKTPEQDYIKALRDGLTSLARLIARHRTDSALTTECSQHIIALQDIVTNLEQALASKEPDREELAALYNVSQVIGSSLDLSEVLNQVMDEIIRLTGAERSFLMLLDPETGELEFRAARNMDRETIDSSAFEISRSIVKQVAMTGEPVVTTNAQMDPRFKAQESVIGYNLRSILCVPLRVRGRVTGVIYADNRILTGLFSDHDRDLLAAFANQAAIAIENARLFESVSNAKKLMDNIFASIASGVITTDIHDQVTLFNRAAERLMYKQSTSVVGSPLADALPLLAKEFKTEIERVKQSGERLPEFERKVLHPDRGQLILRANISPLKDADERIQGLAFVVDDLTEQRRLEAHYQMFRRILPPAVVEQLPSDPTELRLGGQRQEITSLFADIRGFTGFSRQQMPEKLVEILNRYLEVGGEAVLSEEGTLDKILGDCVVALFNAPLRQEQHTLRAVRAALKIREGVARLHEQLPPSYRLYYGVGINVGEAIVGFIGTEQQMNYTAIGSSVNLASRLQSAAAPGQILLSQTAYERVKDYVEARPLPPLEAKGFSEPLIAYELLGLK